MKTILLVDDEPTILYSLSKAIRKLCNFHGEVKTVENGKNALKEINDCFYDVCFLDVNLPDANGLEIMKEIKEKSPETKIVIMTASFISDAMKKLIKEKASLFLPKPFELSQIKAFIKQTFERGFQSVQ